MYSRVFIKSTIRASVSAHLSAVNGEQQGSMGCNHGYGLSQEGIRNHFKPYSTGVPWKQYQLFQKCVVF